jgi:hypothetical protein
MAVGARTIDVCAIATRLEAHSALDCPRATTPGPRSPRDGDVDLALTAMSDIERIRNLGRFVHWRVPIAYSFAALEAAVFAVFPQPQIGLTSVVLLLFAVWLTISWRRLRRVGFVSFLTRLALGMFAVVVALVILQPTVVAELTVATILPVLVVLP